MSFQEDYKLPEGVYDTVLKTVIKAKTAKDAAG